MDAPVRMEWLETISDMDRLFLVIALFACISCATGDAKKVENAEEKNPREVLMSMIDTTKTYPVNFLYSNLGNYPDNVIVTDITSGEVKGSVLARLSDADIRAFGDSLIIMRNVPEYEDVLVLCKGKNEVVFSAKTDDFESLSLDSEGRLPLYADGALSADVNSYKWKQGSAQIYFSYKNHDVYQLHAAVTPSGDFVCLDTAVTVMGRAISFSDLKISEKMNNYMAQIESDISKIK